MLNHALSCAAGWNDYAGCYWSFQPLEPLEQLTLLVVRELRVKIEIATTPAHAESFASAAGSHLSALKAWEANHPLSEKVLPNGDRIIERRGYNSRHIRRQGGGSSNTPADDPREMLEAATGLALLIGEWVNKLATAEERMELGLEDEAPTTNATAGPPTINPPSQNRTVPNVSLRDQLNWEMSKASVSDLVDELLAWENKVSAKPTAYRATLPYYRDLLDLTLDALEVVRLSLRNAPHDAMSILDSLWTHLNAVWNHEVASVLVALGRDSTPWTRFLVDPRTETIAGAIAICQDAYHHCHLAIEANSKTVDSHTINPTITIIEIPVVLRPMAQALSSKDEWEITALPNGVTFAVLEALDGARAIQVAEMMTMDATPHPGAPPKRSAPIIMDPPGWFSPIGQPGLKITWRSLEANIRDLNVRADVSYGGPPRVRLTASARAALALLILESSASAHDVSRGPQNTQSTGKPKIRESDIMAADDVAKQYKFGVAIWNARGGQGEPTDPMVYAVLQALPPTEVPGTLTPLPRWLRLCNVARTSECALLTPKRPRSDRNPSIPSTPSKSNLK